MTGLSDNAEPEKKEDCARSTQFHNDRLPESDRFNREPFANKIAASIVNKTGNKNLVIGIYGKWGEGKTTLLDYIKKELENNPQYNKNFECIQFNPWKCSNKDELYLQFYQQIYKSISDIENKKKEGGFQGIIRKGQALINSNKSNLKKFGENIEKLGDLLETFSIPGSSSIKTFAELICQIDLDKLRNDVNNALKTLESKLVIFIDDIDRLDEEEIHALFSLIKVSADFNNTVYVLALDDEMVAKALNKKYYNNESDGTSFLEKIVQVPLELPRIDDASLYDFFYENIEIAINPFDIQLGEIDKRVLDKLFLKTLGVRKRTPRMAKRFSNSLLFALTCLSKDEINTLDIILIEAVKIFYPSLYKFIKDNPGLFQGHDHSLKNKLDEIYDKIDNERESKAIKGLIEHLFPLIKYPKNEYGQPSSDTTSLLESLFMGKHIGSPFYFDRYFSYTISHYDVSDESIKTLLKDIKDGKIKDLEARFKEMITVKNAKNFIIKLREKEDEMDRETAEKLIIPFSKAGECFPDTNMNNRDRNPLVQSSIFAYLLLKKFPLEERFNIAIDVLKVSKPLSFAHNFLKYIRLANEDLEKEKKELLIPKDKAEELNKFLFTDRFKKYIEDKTNKPLYINFPQDTIRMFYLLSQYLGSDKVKNYLNDTFKLDKNNVSHFLACYSDKTVSFEMNCLIPSDFTKNGFNSLSEVADLNAVYNSLLELFGEEIKNPVYEDYDYKEKFRKERSYELKIAHQFSAFYKSHQEKEKGKQEKGEQVKV